MFKKTVKYTYTDFDEVDHELEETLWFHMSKSHVLENLDLFDELDVIRTFFEGDQRELTTSEKQTIVNLVRRVLRLSYGVRSADGKKFKQDGVWEDFYESAVYDELFSSLFADNDAAFNFITAVLPKNLREQALTEAREQHPDLFAAVPEKTAVEVPAAASQDTRPAWLREGRAPSPAEFKVATEEEKILAFQLKSAA